MRFPLWKLLKLLEQSLFVACAGWLGSVITYRVERARLVSLVAGRTVRVANADQPTRFVRGIRGGCFAADDPRAAARGGVERTAAGVEAGLRPARRGEE